MTELSEYPHTAATAEYLGVAQNTIRKWASRGDIPVYRNPANGYRLFKRSELERFLQKIEKQESSKYAATPPAFDSQRMEFKYDK